jgi:uncharacterized membrane protein
MNEAERRELEQLKARQSQLESDLHRLSQQLRSFEQRAAQNATQQQQSPAQDSPTVSRASVTPRQAPPPIIPPSAFENPAHRVLPATPPPLSVTCAADAGLTGRPKAEPVISQVASGMSEGVTSPEQGRVPLSSIPSVVPPQTPARSFEMRLGTFWLVRIGIVMVLTGLVFFGNLAYQNYVSKLGPGGKVCLLYLASGALLGAGWWWQRKAVETLRNYAQVVFAGGLAALYFTTYAAHHLEQLRVIQSAWADGILLLACAGLMVWAAERKRSELLALFAVALAYYTSIITRVGYFTLWSNLVLSLAAVFFLLRNRWAALSFGSLFATYAAYGFWRFFDGSAWHWASPSEGLWMGALFLMLYWTVFTGAVFVSRAEKFAGQNRAAFATLNNGAFFTLFLLTMLQVHHGGFWKFSLIYGSVLLGLAVLATRLLKQEPLVANTYLTQGLVLITVGLISKFAGLQLALILAAESVLLLVLGQQRKNLILVTAAFVTAALAVFWGMDGMKQFDTRGLWLGIGLGILMMANAFLAHRNLGPNSPQKEGTLAASLRPQPAYFTVLALAVWLVVTWNNTAGSTFPLFVAVEAVILTLSVYALGVPEVALFGQGFLVLAHAAWFMNWSVHPTDLAWWNPMLMIAASLGLSHWWPAQSRISPKRENQLLWPALYALGIEVVLYCWLAPQPLAPSWMVTTSVLAVALTVYGVLTRAWFVAGCAQLFLLVSTAQFALQLLSGLPPWRFTLAPIAALVLLCFGTVAWLRRYPASDRVTQPLLSIALVYRWVAFPMSLVWICEYVPGRERMWLFSLLGLCIFLWAGLRRNREALVFSSAYTATAFVLFWMPLLNPSTTVYLPNLLVIFVLLAQRQMAHRLPDRYAVEPAVHNIVIVVGALSLWLFLSRWVLELANGFYLTASWSVLALVLFGVGLFLRERMYRWVGLGVLAFALGRVVMFDVWKLETVYRILSFMALGIVLLVLGFIYSKYQEKIREWL